MLKGSLGAALACWMGVVLTLAPTRADAQTTAFLDSTAAIERITKATAVEIRFSSGISPDMRWRSIGGWSVAKRAGRPVLTFDSPNPPSGSAVAVRFRTGNKAGKLSTIGFAIGALGGLIVSGNSGAWSSRGGLQLVPVVAGSLSFGAVGAVVGAMIDNWTEYPISAE